MTCAWKEMLSILPAWLQAAMDRQYAQTLQEIRLRLGKTVRLVGSHGKTALDRCATKEDMNYIVNAACKYSPWTASGTAQGYLTAAGGHRIGLCGEAVLQDGRMTGLRSITALNIRVARDFEGIANNPGLTSGSVLILGSPGSGKTTLLRDLIRQRSCRESVSVVDERGELFPFHIGKPCFSMGQAVDVLTGCPKGQGVDTVIRTMSPDTVAVDEITAADDCNALISAAWCGVKLLATAHASDAEDLQRRNVYKPLAESGLFDTLVVMRPDKSWRVERMRP